MIDLSIIIVNYKNPDLIKQCVESIVKNETALNYEIIVVDNNSEDNSEQQLKQIYPQLVWIQMGYNSGYGRANNVGIKESKGKELLLLNSDIIITKPNTIKNTLLFFTELPTYKEKVLGIRLTNTDGTYQSSLRLDYYGLQKEIKKNPIYISIFDRKSIKKDKEQEKQKNAHYKSGYVFWINGAFLMMHKDSILTKNLFFDEDFFLYAEDNEWCWRASRKGMKFYHWHEPELIHIGSASMQNNTKKRAQITVSEWLLVRKTHNVFYYLVLLIVIFINLCLCGLLYFQHKLRHKKQNEYHIEESRFRKLKWYLLFQYGFGILFKRQISDKTSFYTNCYEDKHI